MRNITKILLIGLLSSILIAGAVHASNENQTVENNVTTVNNSTNNILGSIENDVTIISEKNNTYYNISTNTSQCAPNRENYYYKLESVNTTGDYMDFTIVNANTGEYLNKDVAIRCQNSINGTSIYLGYSNNLLRLNNASNYISTKNNTLILHSNFKYAGIYICQLRITCTELYTIIPHNNDNIVVEAVNEVKNNISNITNSIMSPLIDLITDFKAKI